MTGSIYDINQQTGRVAVLTEDGEFSVFEFLGGNSVEKGDRVRWRGATSLGPTMLTNLTRGERYEVQFEDHWVPKSEINALLDLAK